MSEDPFARALTAAGTGAGAHEPGTVLWDESGGVCRGAVMLAPDQAIGERTLMAMGLLALYDALAVLAPAQVPIEIGDAGCLVVDGGRAAWVRASLGDGDPADWAVIGVAVTLTSGVANPGDAPAETCLFEEGFGCVSAAAVLAGFCRHLLTWIEAWRDEGADGLARAVAARSVGRMVRA